MTSWFRCVLDASKYFCMLGGKMWCKSLYDFMVHFSILETSKTLYNHEDTAIYMYVYNELLRREKNATKSQFYKQRTTCLNLEFSSSHTGCHTWLNVHSLPYYLLIGKERIFGFMPFPWVYVKCRQFCPAFELNTPSLFPMTVAVTPRTPSKTFYLSIYLSIYYFT